MAVSDIFAKNGLLVAVKLPLSPFIQHALGKKVLKGSKTGNVVTGAQAVVNEAGPVHGLNCEDPQFALTKI